MTRRRSIGLAGNTDDPNTTRYRRTCFQGPVKFVVEMAINDRWPYKGGIKRNVKAKYFKKEIILKSCLTSHVVARMSDRK